MSIILHVMSHETQRHALHADKGSGKGRKPVDEDGITDRTAGGHEACCCTSVALLEETDHAVDSSRTIA